MPGSAGLSAIAKRRLKEDETQIPSFEQPPDVRTRPIGKRERGADDESVLVKSKRLQRQELRSLGTGPSSPAADEETNGFANSFEGLASQEDVTNAGGKVEELSSRRLRLLVAKGKV